MPDRHDFMATLRQAARTRDPDTRADLYSEAMFAGLEAAVPNLASDSDSGSDRHALVVFMRAFARPAWLPFLALWQADEDEPVRAMVAAALLHQKACPETLALMERAVSDPSVMVRTRAVRAMDGSGEAMYRPLLQRMAEEDDESAVRALAAAALL